MPHRLIAAVAAVLGLAVAGCGSTNSTASPRTTSTAPPSESASSATAAATEVTGHQATITMSDFAFQPQALSAKAGTLRITAKNDGHVAHELILLRTTRAADSLPTNGARASEAASVGEVSEQKPGSSGTHTFNLKPGSYVYICNVPGHYAGGMRGTLTVK